jgi:chromosomal replication initiation ATPase DnaA
MTSKPPENKGAAPQIPLGFTPLPTAWGRADFLEHEGNRVALSMALRWPEPLQKGLIIHGPNGAGKTHLAHIAQAQTGALWVEPASLSASTHLTVASASRLVLDNVDLALNNGGRGAEVGLFHLLNHLASGDGAVLLTAQLPPAQWPVQLPDLRSRLLALSAARLDLPDEAALAQLMAKLFSDRQLRVPDEVIQYVVKRIERTPAMAQSIVEQLDRAALAAGRAITLPLARTVLEPLA